MQKQTVNRVIRWIVTSLVVLGAAFLIWTIITNSEKPGYEQPLTPVRTAKAQRRIVEESLTLTGYVQADATIPVVPFVSGTIMEYPAKEGDQVLEDDVLAVIDERPYQLQMAQAQAVYATALATYERISGLYKSGAATRQQYDETKAQVEAYKAQLDLAQLQLDYCKVQAPVNGTILVSNSAKGSVAATGTPIFVIADITALKIALDVPEHYFDIFNREKNEISAVVTREGSSTDARLSSVAPYVSPQSKTFRVTFDLADPQGFVPGMFVSVRIIYNRMENVLTLDWKTMNNDGSVYAYDPEMQRAVLIQPEIIASDSRGFAIADSYGDFLFITDGQGSVLDGKKVRVIE